MRKLKMLVVVGVLIGSFFYQSQLLACDNETTQTEQKTLPQKTYGLKITQKINYLEKKVDKRIRKIERIKTTLADQYDLKDEKELIKVLSLKEKEVSDQEDELFKVQKDLKLCQRGVCYYQLANYVSKNIISDLKAALESSNLVDEDKLIKQIVNKHKARDSSYQGF
jgi:hypothetical protein